MKLQERIQEDLTYAITHNLLSKETLKVIVAEMSRGKSKEVPDDKVISILRSLKESAIICDKPLELLVYDMYLPLMMSEENMRELVKELISLDNLSKPSDLGQLMKTLGLYGPGIDKKFCSSVAKELLSQ